MILPGLRWPRLSPMSVLMDVELCSEPLGFLAPEVLPLIFDCCEVRSNALYDAVLDSDDGALLRYTLL